jgi:hypothetical protein
MTSSLRAVRGARFIPRPGAPSLPAAVGWACSLRAPVLSPPLRAPHAARRRKALPCPSAPLLCPPSPLSLLTARLRRGGAALLLKEQLGDLRGAVERLREVVAAARANPDMNPDKKEAAKVPCLALPVLMMP